DRRQEVIGVVGLHARRVRTSASVRPATRTRLSRLLLPPTTCTVAGATRSARATRATTAALAAPSTGGAVTRTRRTPSCQPRISSREARGCTRRRSRALSALRLAGVLTEVGRHHAVVALERRTQVLDELAARSEEHTSELQSPDHLVC